MKLVIFDCDGTLVDSQANICAALTHAFRSHDLAVPARARMLGIVGLSLPETFAVLAPDEPVAVQLSLAAHYRDAFVTGPLKERAPEPLYPGIGAAIAALHARDDVVLGIATGKSKRGVARLLDREGWMGRFLTIQTADDHPSKPHPSMILKAMAEAGAAPHATVMIGDTAFDMSMANNAGVGALGVTWGYHDVARLQAAGAHDVIDSGDALLDTIARRLAQQAEAAQ